MKCKVLVAEDELIERKVLCKTLQKYLGDLILLYEARNGREAIALFDPGHRDARRDRAGCGPEDPGDGQKLRHPLSDRV